MSQSIFMRRNPRASTGSADTILAGLKKVERHGTGIDAVQVMMHALKMIRAELYTSDYHRSRRLEWLAPRWGHGFPVPNNIRDLLIGDDRTFL
jgi:hypothetical protein